MDRNVQIKCNAVKVELAARVVDERLVGFWSSGGLRRGICLRKLPIATFNRAFGATQLDGDVEPRPTFCFQVAQSLIFGW